MRVATAAGVAAVGASALLAGCGTTDDRSQVREVAERFYAAIDADRGEEACGLLSGPAREALEGQTGQSCGRVITRLDYEDKNATVVSARVFITNAKVDLGSGESAFLSREARSWKLSAVACAPEGGKPRDRPFDCELEA